MSDTTLTTKEGSIRFDINLSRVRINRLFQPEFSINETSYLSVTPYVHHNYNGFTLYSCKGHVFFRVLETCIFTFTEFVRNLLDISECPYYLTKSGKYTITANKKITPKTKELLRRIWFIEDESGVYGMAEKCYFVVWEKTTSKEAERKLLYNFKQLKSGMNDINILSKNDVTTKKLELISSYKYIKRLFPQTDWSKQEHAILAL